MKSAKQDTPIRTLIADDHGVMRAGLCALLNAEPDLQVVGEATDGPETLLQAARLLPDVVLLDIRMPGPGGVQITRQLKEIRPDTRVLILTAHEDETLLQETIRAGASGYVTKRAIKSELISAIHAIWRGDLYVHPSMTRALFKNAIPASGDTPVGPLPPREIQVLRLIAQGHTNSQTAEALSISVRTIETHRANIMDKLGIRGRVELVRYAMEHGLLE